jgi:hypothetical protein
VNTFKPKAAPITAHKSIHYKSHIGELTAVLLHTGDNKKVERLMYATVHSLLMGRRVQKHASVDVL